MRFAVMYVVQLGAFINTKDIYKTNKSNHAYIQETEKYNSLDLVEKYQMKTGRAYIYDTYKEQPFLKVRLLSFQSG